MASEIEKPALEAPSFDTRTTQIAQAASEVLSEMGRSSIRDIMRGSNNEIEIFTRQLKERLQQT